MASDSSLQFSFELREVKDGENYDDGITEYAAKLCNPILDAFDDRSEDLYDLGQEALNFNGWLRSTFREGAWAYRIVPSEKGRGPRGKRRRKESDESDSDESSDGYHEELDDGNLLILDKLRVVLQYRGHKYGRRLVQYVLDRLHQRHSLALLQPGFYHADFEDQKEQQAWTKEQKEEKWRKQILYWQEAGFRRLGRSKSFGRPSSHPVHATPIVDDAMEIASQYEASKTTVKAEAERLTALGVTDKQQWPVLEAVAHDEHLKILGPRARQEQETEIEKLRLWYPYTCKRAAREGFALWNYMCWPQWAIAASNDAEKQQEEENERAMQARNMMYAQVAAGTAQRSSASAVPGFGFGAGPTTGAGSSSAAAGAAGAAELPWAGFGGSSSAASSRV